MQDGQMCLFLPHPLTMRLSKSLVLFALQIRPSNTSRGLPHFAQCRICFTNTNMHIGNQNLYYYICMWFSESFLLNYSSELQGHSVLAEYSCLYRTNGGPQLASMSGSWGGRLPEPHKNLTDSVTRLIQEQDIKTADKFAFIILNP